MRRHTTLYKSLYLVFADTRLILNFHERTAYGIQPNGPLSRAVALQNFVQQPVFVGRWPKLEVACGKRNDSAACAECHLPLPCNTESVPTRRRTRSVVTSPRCRARAIAANMLARSGPAASNSPTVALPPSRVESTTCASSRCKRMLRQRFISAHRLSQLSNRIALPAISAGDLMT